MSQSHQTFTAAMLRARNLVQIGALIEAQATNVDYQECYRASLVLGVSCFDHYIHALCVEAALEMASGSRTETPLFASTSVPFSLARANLLPNAGWEWLKVELRRQLAFQTFQRPEKVSAALKIVDVRNNLWKRLAARLGLDKNLLVATLELIIDRRNMIAHEADIDPAWNTPRSLTRPETEDAFDMLEKIAQAIEDECW